MNCELELSWNLQEKPLKIVANFRTFSKVRVVTDVPFFSWNRQLKKCLFPGPWSWLSFIPSERGIYIFSCLPTVLLSVCLLICHLSFNLMVFEVSWLAKYTISQGNKSALAISRISSTRDCFHICTGWDLINYKMIICWFESQFCSARSLLRRAKYRLDTTDEQNWQWG